MKAKSALVVVEFCRGNQILSLDGVDTKFNNMKCNFPLTIDCKRHLKTKIIGNSVTPSIGLEKISN